MLSVVIPTRNRARILDLTLAALDRQTLDAAALQVIVVDDGSTDGTRALLKRPRPYAIERIPHVHEGYRLAALRNRGWRRSRAARVAFLDDDVVPGPAWAQRLVEQEAPLVIGRMFGLWGGPREDARAKEACANLSTGRRVEIGRLSDDPRERVAAAWPRSAYRAQPWALGWTGNLSVTRKLLELTQGFDESFIGYGDEDIEFCFRLWRRQVRFHFEPQAWAVHYPAWRKTSRGPARMRNRRRFLRKFPQLPVELLFLTTTTGHAQHWDLVSGLFGADLVPDFNDKRYQPLVKGLADRAGARPLVIGSAALAAMLPNARALDLHPPRWPPGQAKSDQLWLLGVATPFPAKTFSSAVITEVWRALPVSYRAALLHEAWRVARNVVILDTGHVPRTRPPDWSGESAARAFELANEGRHERVLSASGRERN